MAEHESIKKTQVRELLSAPFITGHLTQRMEPLPYTTSSCESGKTKFSLKAIDHAEGDLIVVETAKHRVF